MGSGVGRRDATGCPPTHAADSHLRRTDAADAAPRRDLLLRQFARRGGRVGGCGHGIAPGRHAVSVIPEPGRAFRPRTGAGGTDVPVPVERGRHVQGPAAPDALPLEGRQHLLYLRQLGNAVSARCGMGDGLVDPRRRHCSSGMDWRGVECGGGLPPWADLRGGLSGAGDPDGGEQPVGYLDVPRVGWRGGAVVLCPRPGIRHSIVSCGRK